MVIKCFEMIELNRRVDGVVTVLVKDSLQVLRLPCNHPMLFECLTLRFVTFDFVLVTLYIPSLVAQFVIDHVDDVLNEFSQ